MATKSLCHIHKCEKLYQTLNHEIAHQNGLGETSATAMGKIGDLRIILAPALPKSSNVPKPLPKWQKSSKTTQK